MNLYELAIVYSQTQMDRQVFNDEQVALKAFAAEERMRVMGAKLYTCEFVNGKLTHKDCIKQM